MHKLIFFVQNNDWRIRNLGHMCPFCTEWYKIVLQFYKNYRIQRTTL